MKKINIILIILSLFFVTISLVPTKNINNISSLKNTNLPYFTNNFIKTRGNNIYTVKINNYLNYNIEYKTSNSSKIRIIDSNNYYVKFERIKRFIDTESIDLYVNNKKYDRLDITCFNEIIKINDINIYKENSTIDTTKEENYLYDQGYYTIVFDLEKLNNNDDFETDTILELEEFIIENISKNITKIINTNISYFLYLDIEYFFKTSNYKTIFFSFDEVKYAITFLKSL